MHDVEASESLAAGLYVVATPIGNLGDITGRALEVLRSAALIAAEDTRHSQRLLAAHAVKTQCIPYHEHSEEKTTQKVITAIRAGQAVALISDAGTPLISDPGYRLVNRVIEEGAPVIPIPGASALLAALSVAGLPTDSFMFAGFLAAKSAARCSRLQQLADFPHTLVFYEAPHRLEDSLVDMVAVFGAERRAVLARELTKRYETLIRKPLGELLACVREDSDQSRGEIVLLVEGGSGERGAALDEDKVLETLVAELPLKQAAGLAAKITGAKKNELYKRALSWKNA
jgi:16S rRNA (cytidine1402-2'-O)-methyltransferase